MTAVRTRVADGWAYGDPIDFLRCVQQRVAVGARVLADDLHYSHVIAAFPTPPPSPPLGEVDPWREPPVCAPKHYYECDRRGVALQNTTMQQ